MGSITKINNKDGSHKFKVKISRGDTIFCKSFFDEEDAKLYIFYKERLIDNMKNFEIPLHETLTLEQIFELKIEKTTKIQRKEIEDFNLSLSRLQTCFGKNKCYSEISIEDWTQAVKSIMHLKVYRGAKNKNGERDISLKSVKKIFAHASSCITFCQNMGFKIDNKPMIVIKNTINPLIKSS